ncbi:MAG TPA: hypothetical protein VH186_24310 [Chloroflexia bacterium]|nr:hypothetical protein [Chloroflexia bacterium]
MNETEQQLILKNLQKLRHKKVLNEQNTKEIYNYMHALAETHYEPAKRFFINCLTANNVVWRLNAIRCLGFHYNLSEENLVLETIRLRIVEDPSSLVRLSSASVLGTYSKLWPDWALVTALESDPCEEVRKTAFDSLLQIAKISPLKIKQELEGIKEGRIKPSIYEVNRIISESGLSLEPLP